MQYTKTAFLTFLSIVIGSFKAQAELFLPMAHNLDDRSHTMVEIREFLLTGDTIMLIGFILWIGYIVFFFPRNTLKKS